jgi:hypothetical protein
MAPGDRRDYFCLVAESQAFRLVPVAVQRRQICSIKTGVNTFSVIMFKIAARKVLLEKDFGVLIK